MDYTEAKIREKNGKFYVMNEDGTKVLSGPYKTKEEAVNRLKQIEFFKNKKEG